MTRWPTLTDTQTYAAAGALALGVFAVGVLAIVSPGTTGGLLAPFTAGFLVFIAVYFASMWSINAFLSE